jgi:hypothetical protein
MTRKKDLEKLKPPPKITKTQGSVIPGRSTFIDEIIKKGESQASVGPRKRIPQALVSPTTAHAKIHSITQIERAFRIQISHRLEEGSSNNHKTAEQ